MSNDLDADVGVDVKYGLTQNLTADFTYNTDFAQVEADEQQVNLTRFSLFFPEKREFFLENQGTFTFGGVPPASAAGDTPDPVLQPAHRPRARDASVPIEAGGRLTGRVGRYSVGAAQHPDPTTDAALGARADATSPCARVKRDILRRSSIGVHRAPDRSPSRDGGPDATRRTASTARSRSSRQPVRQHVLGANTGRRRSTATTSSYRGAARLRRRSLRRCRSSTWPSATTSTRRSASSGATTCAAASARSASARGRRTSHVGPQVLLDRLGAPTSRTAPAGSRRGNWDGEFGVEFQTQRPAHRRLRQHLRVPAAAVRDRARRHRAGRAATTSATARASSYFGQQRGARGTVSVEHGTFYNGTRTVLGFRARTRRTVTPQLLDRAHASRSTASTCRRARSPTRLVGSRVTYTMTPLMFVSALVQYNSSSQRGRDQRPAAVGVSAGQRAVRRLQRAARHARRPVPRCSETGRSS